MMMKLMMVMVATTMTKVVVMMLIVMTMALLAQDRHALQQSMQSQIIVWQDLGLSLHSTLSMPTFKLARAKAEPTLTTLTSVQVVPVPSNCLPRLHALKLPLAMAGRATSQSNSAPSPCPGGAT